MAAKPLDSATCTTAADAFKSPLPQVRQFHRNLTSELDEKNARLRTLVGGSYRQLLGTAEMILEMRSNIGTVEEKLGRVGSGCGRGVIGNKAKGLAKMQDSMEEGQGTDRIRWVARLNSAGTDVLSKGVGTRLVIAAKVLVLSRLLVKSLTDSALVASRDEKQFAEELKKKWESLKARLLRAIDKRLRRTDGDEEREELSQALCAYSLTTSSGTKDVLRHLLQVRGAAMAIAFEDAGVKQDTPGILIALESYTRTLLDVQALIPRRLAEALASLKTKPLLRDDSIRGLESLRLDVCEKWFGDPILFFTPYIRHDDLEGPDAVGTLKSWAKEASEVLLSGFGNTLQHVSEFKTVVDLRSKCLEFWIKEGGKARGFDPSFVLDGLRKVINDCMVKLLESRISKLHLVGTEIEGTLGTWISGVTDQKASLWDKDMIEMQISGGAVVFKKDILARTYGRDNAVSRAIGRYKTWRHLLDEMITVLDQLRKQRWDDDPEDIEDDASIESRNILLSKYDPEILLDHLETSLHKAYKGLHDKISVLLNTHKESEDIGQVSVYILRIIRDIRSDLPKNASLQFFGLSLVSPLHQNLATLVSADSLESLLKSFGRKNVPGRALWEGNPELPVQSSPYTYKFLHNLSLAMARMGSDLWTPAAVRVLKDYIRSELSSRCGEILQNRGENHPDPVSEATSNGAAGNGDSGLNNVDKAQIESTETDSKTKQKEALIQKLFDILVLREALQTKSGIEDGLQAMESAVESRVNMEPIVHKRIQQGAKEFWKRTSLLFGLLASA
ncbi:hypothetical protein OIDMADRAFT_171677 [Oidiodendron maius Zn]|uniref:Conserved oligomeric Golgi complex subunit 1 n=1 Tax=Oidiodendron maius (strain Zn) TaxID=913774 RepID=A0A0C3GX16_OIDMZ|nr:hypothetical protein OIDMADRAFT_171677 [Oidiodendron maius Zn]